MRSVCLSPQAATTQRNVSFIYVCKNSAVERGKKKKNIENVKRKMKERKTGERKETFFIEMKE